MAEQFVTITQAIKALNISRPTLYRHIKCREVPAVHLGGRVLIPASFFEDLKEKALAILQTREA
jgi:excisionase family DNA binding protein